MKLCDAVRAVLTTNLGDREIARSLSISKTTVRRYRTIARSRGYCWELLSTKRPKEVRALFNRPRRQGSTKRLPDFKAVAAEVKAGLTRQQLWEEYRAMDPDRTVSYSHYTGLLRQEIQRDPTMVQHHIPGERVFVDFCGDLPHYLDPNTGERVSVQMFAAAMGESQLLFAQCVPTQAVPDWIHCHCRLMEFLGRAPAIVVPDNLRSAVSKSGKQPVIQRAYADFARHYGMIVLPARPRRPKDKGKVENGVRIIQRHVRFLLRRRKFFSLDELNAGVEQAIEQINQRAYKRMADSNRSLRYAQVDLPAMRSLPELPYVYAEWVSRQTVSNTYHLAVYGHFYSVPHELIGKRVEARVTRYTVEFFCDHVRIAEHARSSVINGYTTANAHMPEDHRSYADRNPERMKEWARKVGASAVRLVARQLDRDRPELGLRACEALRSLAEQFGVDAFERAARRAWELKSPTATTVKSLLRSQAAKQAQPLRRHVTHGNAGPRVREEQPC